MLPFLLILFALLQSPAEAPAPAPATPPAAAPLDPAAPLPPTASVPQVLTALNLRGQDLREFDADVSLTDTDAATGQATTRSGRVLYQKSDTNSRIRVTFDTKDEGRGPKPERLEYLLDGRVLTDRNYRKQIEVRRTVLKEGEKANLLKLGEGPFPLPIGQDPAEVQRQFTVTLLPPEGNSPHLRLTPKPGTRFERRFSQIDVTVDPVSHFPTKIETTDPNGTNTRTTDLKNLRLNPNPPLKDADFTLAPVPADWPPPTEEPYRD